MTKTVRVYDWGNWARPEDLTRCIAEVPDFTGFHFRQCLRKRVDEDFCKQHGQMRREGRYVSVPTEEAHNATNT